MFTKTVETMNAPPTTSFCKTQSPVNKGGSSCTIDACKKASTGCKIQ